jgi:hypothetical protein
MRPPKIVQSRGGRIVFRSLPDNAEVYLDGRRVESSREVELAPQTATAILSVLLSGPGGLTAPVEIVRDDV